MASKKNKPILIHNFQPTTNYITQLLELLKEYYPKAECSLNYNTVFELLVATILSAQCTDERVNKVTASLFRKYSTINDYANVSITELEQDIHSTGFFRNKAKNIQATAQILIDQYQGQVPKTMNELLTLPGVARKTANVVLGNAFGQAVGIVVDTHVRRISQLLGLTTENNPEKIEKDLIKIIPKSDWIDFSHLLIFHGRQICKANRPDCQICPLSRLCPSSKTIK
ncbi:MAG: endonuclease III [Acidobacteria bacterium]|nr:endonuclease III [Acidobacteriota bacterium]